VRFADHTDQLEMKAGSGVLLRLFDAKDPKAAYSKAMFNSVACARHHSAGTGRVVSRSACRRRRALLPTVPAAARCLNKLFSVRIVLKTEIPFDLKKDNLGLKKADADELEVTASVLIARPLEASALTPGQIVPSFSQSPRAHEETQRLNSVVGDGDTGRRPFASCTREGLRSHAQHVNYA